MIAQDNVSCTTLPEPAPAELPPELPIDLLAHAFDALRDYEKEDDDCMGAGMYDYRRAQILALLAIGFELQRIADRLDANNERSAGRDQL